MFRKFFLVSALVTVLGCSNSPPTNAALEALPHGKPPPSIPLQVSQRELVEMTDTELYTYVNILNWNTFRSYSTLRIINQYAASRGWEPPQTAPICRYAVIPDVPDRPSFKADAIQGTENLEEELMIYIYDSKVADDISQAVFEERLSQMRFFCIY